MWTPYSNPDLAGSGESEITTPNPGALVTGGTPDTGEKAGATPDATTFYTGNNRKAITPDVGEPLNLSVTPGIPCE